MEFGTKEIVTLLATLNFSGTKSSESCFYWHQETIYKGITEITTDIIKQATNEEIKATILDGFMNFAYLIRQCVYI